MGEFKKSDTSIQVTGLKPGNYYSIRVLATNTANFTTLGPAIRIRTIPPPPLNENGNTSLGDADAPNEPAAVHATSTPFETALQSTSNRDIIGAQHQPKRMFSGRQNSPATSSGEQGAVQSMQTGSSDEDESPETIQKLTERLNFLRSEKERVDRETAEEEEESRRNIVELSKERDRLKQEYKEKEEASAELRRHGNHLDKLNRAAQSRKAAKEKQLQQKKAERQKIKDDIARWGKEVIEMRQNTAEMKREKEEVIAAKDRDITEMRKGIAEDLAAIKILEEEIREKGVQIKALEKKQEKLNSDATDNSEHPRVERESDEAWEARMQVMQAQIGSLWQTLQQAQLEQQQAEEHLAWWMAKRARNPEQFAPIPSLDFAVSMQRSRSRKSRQPSSRTSTISSPSAGFAGGYSVSSPFFNMSNGMTGPPLTERLGVPQTDAEMLTGGGPMSPAANNLLPSNLFQDNDLTGQRFLEGVSHEPTANNGTSELFSGHAVTNSDTSAIGPHTPGSTGSRTGSIFSSPQDNAQILQSYQVLQDPLLEVDQNSIHSTSAPFDPSVAADANPLTTSRLANLFTSTFNRQRGKPGIQEAPPLGTLKQGQSQSFPRDVDQDDALDANGNRKRRGSHGNWANPMSGLLNRNNPTPHGPGLINARTGSGRRSRLNMFAPKIDGMESTVFADRASSSRPSSTYSYDQILARPSNESQRFGWPAPETVPNRSSPLGAHSHWASGPWSHAPSRRPSIQHGSTSNLSIGSTPLEPDNFPGSFSKQNSEQAPIGTRPQSAKRPVTPSLNPAAPTFKTLFSRGDARKSSRREKTGGKNDGTKDRDSEKGETEDMESAHESSPQNPRLSRDAQSITTAASTADSHESFDRSTSGTPSEAVTPSGPKETLIQKITRKSSSSKFNVPWVKERGLFSKRNGEPSTPGELDGDTSSENQLGKSAESSGSTPQLEKAGRSSLSWPNIRRKSKKGDQAAIEAVERGSELGDDEDA